MLVGRSLIALLASVALAATACSGDPDANNTDNNGQPEPQALELETVQNPNNALSYYVSWSTDAPSTTSLEVDCGDEWSHTYGSETMATDHEVFVMGLWDGASCDLSATSVSQEEVTSTGETTLEVGPLPDFLPELDVTTHVDGSVQPGWTLFNLTNDVDDIPLIVAIADDQGRYRWYHQLATSRPGADTDVRLTEKGILVGGVRYGPHATLLDWQGNVLWNPGFEMHHHIMPYGEGQYLYLAISPDCPEVTANSLRVWDIEQAEIVEEYLSCEWIVPDEIRGDWDHLNSAEIFPDDPNAILVSSRNQNSLYKLDIQAEDSLWQLGVGGDFDMAEEDLFWQQHAPEFQEDGDILIFDNGMAGERESSRAIIVSYDTDAMTAEVVWEYSPDPVIFTPIWGDSDRMDNGNVLSTFGHRNAELRSYIHEVTFEGELVWALETPNGWGWYRSERIAVPDGGSVLE